MKIGILTFQFAHNYGAMLQAYSLKRFLEGEGHTVCMIPYHPVHFQAAYGVSPFVRGATFKQRIRNALTYGKRAPQAKLFEDFKQSFLYGGHPVREFWDHEGLRSFCSSLDLVIYGSDQVWNDGIIHGDTAYFGDAVAAPKISYGASMGVRQATPLQRQYICAYLPAFGKLSVREPDSQMILQQTASLPSEVVCDPVFLQGAEQWQAIESPVEIRRPYLLIYLLEQNEALVHKARQTAQEQGLRIYSVHPTLGLWQQGAEQLTKVGPREFLYLIRHAACVCTNSFHAVSFSVIYRKKLLHIPNTRSPERTMALLGLLGAQATNGVWEQDLSLCEDSPLQALILNSEKFLRRMAE